MSRNVPNNHRSLVLYGLDKTQNPVNFVLTNNSLTFLVSSSDFGMFSTIRYEPQQRQILS